MQMFADRMAQIPFSNIRTILEQVNRLEAGGKRIMRLDAGRPNFDTPTHIKDACHRALDEGQVYYSSNFGITPLREAISHKLSRDNGLDFCPASEIIVTSGVSEGIVTAMLSMLNPGDEVLLMEPVFPAYRMAAEMAGAKAVAVPTHAAFDYQPQYDDLQSMLSNKTKMLVLTTPGNPTGTVSDRQTLNALADFAITNDLLVLSDEIYEKLIYDDAEHISIASLPGMRERTITLNGFSKSHAMTGWRLGYIAADAKLVEVMIRIHQNNVVCANSLAQCAGIAALEGPQEPVSMMVKELDRRRLMMVGELEKLHNLPFVRPKGAMYVYASTEHLPMDAFGLTQQLIEHAGVAIVPWDENHIRLSYGNDYEHLYQAVQRFGEYISTL